MLFSVLPDDVEKYSGSIALSSYVKICPLVSSTAFLIKTEVFRNVVCFNEYYFFCPEDIALSTQLNKAGYSCFVNSDAKLVHLGGGNNVTKTAIATMPAGEKGSIFFFADGSVIKHFFLLSFTIPILFLNSFPM